MSDIEINMPTATGENGQIVIDGKRIDHALSCEVILKVGQPNIVKLELFFNSVIVNIKSDNVSKSSRFTLIDLD